MDLKRYYCQVRIHLKCSMILGPTARERGARLAAVPGGRVRGGALLHRVQAQRGHRRMHVHQGPFTYDVHYTGFSSEIGTKLRDWAVGQAGGSCYSRAALSSNDSKTLYSHHEHQIVVSSILIMNIKLLVSSSILIMNIRLWFRPNIPGLCPGARCRR